MDPADKQKGVESETKLIEGSPTCLFMVTHVLALIQFTVPLITFILVI